MRTDNVPPRPEVPRVPKAPPSPEQLQHDHEVRVGRQAALMGLSPIVFALWRAVRGKRPGE